MSFILRGKKLQKVKADAGDRPVIRIDAEAYNALIDMSVECPYPISRIASEAIKYAFANVQYDREGEE